jgi:hypothetical protein
MLAFCENYIFLNIISYLGFLPFLLVLLFVFGELDLLGLLFKLGRELELLITGLLLLFTGGLAFQLFTLMVLFLIGLLFTTGGLLTTIGFELLRIMVDSIIDACALPFLVVFGIYVRLSDVLTFESINNLDLFVLLLKEYTPEYIRCLEPLLLYI